MSVNARGGGNALLLRFIDSSHFTLFLCVSYLERYAGNVGIHFYLCQKLRSYPSEEIEFFLPQLVQLQVTVETESMALEDLLLDLCNDSTHSTLLVFWQLQAHLTELASDPESYGFQVCKRLYNKLQYLLFNVGDPPSHSIRENTFPALILSSTLAGACGLPSMTDFIRPLVISQGRKQRSHIFHLASKLLRTKSARTVKGTKNASTTTVKKEGSVTGSSNLVHGVSSSSSPDLATTTTNKNNNINRSSVKAAATHNEAFNDNEQENNQDITNEQPDNLSSIPPPHRPSPLQRMHSSDYVYPNTSSNSSPGDTRDGETGSPRLEYLNRRHSPTPSVTSTTSVTSAGAGTGTGTPKLSSSNNLLLMPRDEKIKALKTNYFRCETQFVYALQAISSRLLQVPKQARLSALRAELAMLNRELPAEVDMPMLLPSSSKGPTAQQNRVVRIAPAEATVLNSAERVPFLLLIEYLKDDVDFDPDSDTNKELLARNADRRYIFDIAYLHDQKSYGSDAGDRENGSSSMNQQEIFEEADIGDLGSFAEDEALAASFSSIKVKGAAADISSGASNTVGGSGNKTGSPRASDLSFSSSYRSSSPAVPGSDPHVPLPSSSNQSGAFDVTDIATHMRTAAIMLSQLDAGGSKLPKDEIASIKSKIIASMQAMEEHTIYANGGVFNGEAGERKLENDLKTAGMASSTTKDDPSAANLGEDWAARKERIRRSSPYGHLPNWDLFSVIAKTGSDLRQEAFACQLIQAMQKIWYEADVDVWVKKMQILITNDSSGLVETITNGLSIHSIKKALTNASIAAGNNPKGTISSLSDHFQKVSLIVLIFFFFFFYLLTDFLEFW